MSEKNRGGKSDKPLFLRIVMLTIAAVMVLGLVFGTIAGALS